VVDDEEIVRSMAKTALERAGYSVILACNGTEAVELLAAHPEITAVLLDSNTPGMDGATILNRLKQMRPGVPVILSSGLAQTDSANRGAAAFLQKPYTARQIASLLGRVARETFSPA
jgi:CheY-like chemotaxis protein